MATVSGTVVIAQESRFQLALESGGRQLFVLAHEAPVEPEQLVSLQRRRVQVTVTYSRGSNLDAAVARAIATAND